MKPGSNALSMAGWTPPLFPKQREMYLCPKREILAVGARGSGKTVGLEHRFLRHAWRTNPCRAAIITKTTRQGSLGVWPELTGVIYDQWVGKVGNSISTFRYAKPPYQDNLTKIRSFRLWNRYGGQSEVILFPVERAEDALDKLLSTQFSMIWISEAHLYKSREIYDVARGQLRLMGVPYKDTGLMCDCNPPKEAMKHWLYEVFYTERMLAEEDFPAEWDEPTRAAVLAKQGEMAVFEYDIDENPYLDPGLKASFRATYAKNRIMYDRMIRGLWAGDAGSEGCFSEFSELVHVVGDAKSPNPEDWEVILPAKGTRYHKADGKTLILCGCDLGEGVNHSWHAVQPYFGKDHKVHFNVLDELVITSNPVSVAGFTNQVMEKMAELEKFSGFPIEWLHYSDASAMEFRAAIADREAPSDADATDAGIVAKASDDKIELVGAGPVKRPGWQRRRVDLIQELLREKRLSISAHCFKTIDMLNNLKVNASKSSGFILPGQREKHPFDSLSYLLAMYLIVEMEQEVSLPARRTYAT